MITLAKSWLGSIGAAALLTLCQPNVARALDCHTALLLAIDVSSSVDDREYDLQTQGLAAALRDEDVRAAILSAEGSGIWLSVVYWSGWAHQEFRIPWTPLFDETAIDDFANKISRIKRRYFNFPTAIGRALDFIEGQWPQPTLDCARRVIDMSGDGVNNDGEGPVRLRDRLVAQGVTLNGLVIKGARPDPELHYRNEVIGGPGAFVEVAEDYDDYPRAIRRKLLKELRPAVSALPE
ncbi:MAG: DUF1194 domain-containing protein [Pseudomonadota bacterium]